jgi:hypothetical protein
MEVIDIKNTLIQQDVYDYELNGRVWKIPFIKYGLEKVIDWKRDEIWTQNPSEGTALISARRQDKFNECQCKPVNDASGIRIGWGGGGIDRDTGLPKLGSYKIDQLTMELNLAIPEQQKLYFFIATNPMVLNSPNCWSQKNAMLEIIDKNADAKKRIIERQLKYKALEKSREINSIEQIRDLVSVFEDISITTPDDQIRDLYEDYAEKHPERFLELLESPDRPYMIAYSKSIANNIIQFDLEHGYMFGNVRLGMNKEEVIVYLKKNPNMYKHIVNEVNKESSTVKTFETEVENTGSASETMGVKINESLKSENSELKESMRIMLAKMAELEAKVGESSKERGSSITAANENPVDFSTVSEENLEEKTNKELVEYIVSQGWDQEEWSKHKRKSDLIEYISSKQKEEAEDV